MTPEGKLSAELVAFLEGQGWRSKRNQRTFSRKGFSTGEPGMPDFLFLCYLPSGVTLALWIEMKTPKGELRPQQKTWILRERGRGALVMVVDDVERFKCWYNTEFAWLATAKKAESTHALFSEKG